MAQTVKNLLRFRKPRRSGRCPGEGNGNPLQYSCLENSMDRGAWWSTVHGGHNESYTSEQLTHTHTRTHTCSQLCILARGLASTATWNCQKLLNECIEEVHPSKPRYLNSNFASKVGFCLIPFLKEKSLQSYETFENITSWFLDLLFKLSLKCHECIVTWLRSFEKILFNVFALVSF